MALYNEESERHKQEKCHLGKEIITINKNLVALSKHRCNTKKEREKAMKSVVRLRGNQQ